MLYPADFENKINFTAIRDYLWHHCTFSIGKEQVDALTFQTDPQYIQYLIFETWEMLCALNDQSINFPRCEMHDVRESLSRIRIEGLFLEEQDLFHLRKSLETLRLLTTFFLALPEDRFPALRALYAREELCDVSSVCHTIDTILDKYGQLKDTSSPELFRIRTDLRKAQASVGRTLTSILQQAQKDGMIDKDVTPTLREGRLVIPVSPMYKRKLGGIVHDESASGKTVYIEPQQVVEANNRIRELEGEERRERIRILIQCSNQLRPMLPALLASQLFLGKVDFLLAKATLGKELNAIAPQLVAEPVLNWREAYHPVLLLNYRSQGKEVVPLSIRLDKENRIIVISGPNAGGKSVCLKTVALLQYMLQCGLLVPIREDSVMGCFQHIFIDIGDEQSIEDDLSTYSSHLCNMKYFLRNSNSQTLLLIDEFGGGTEPNIGGAIAEAVLERFCDSKAIGVITTHFDNLKHKAEDTDGIINGAMLYDRKQMRPLFQLSIGQPGSSFAVEIAHQIGLPDTIINRAKELVGEEHIDYEKHLQDIARDKRYWKYKRQEIRQQQKHLEQRIASYDEAMSSIKQKRIEVLKQAQEEASELLRQTNAKIENTIRQIRQADAERMRTKEIRQELSTFQKRVESLPIEKKNGNPTEKPRTKKQIASINNPEITVGCRVRIKGQTIVGEVVNLNGKHARVAFGEMSSQILLSQLEWVSARQAKKIQKERPQTNISDSLRKKKLQFNSQLDLRGERADEALVSLMNYMDDALMVGIEEVRILHGTGTGALREVVRNYLKSLSGITAFHDAHPDEGGAGITVVEI